MEIEYNQDLKPLETVLSGVKRHGDFFVSGVMEMPMPKVDIDGVGTLSFPIPEEQIAAVVRQAERAPYGRGEKTIIDTSVRKVWQIAPAKVRIGGKSWAANFQRILSVLRRYRVVRQPAFLIPLDLSRTGGEIANETGKLCESSEGFEPYGAWRERVATRMTLFVAPGSER